MIQSLIWLRLLRLVDWEAQRLSTQGPYDVNQREKYMSIELLKMDARKVLPYYAPVLLLTVGYVLFQETPLASADWKLNVIACLQGMVIAWVLFNDAAGIGAFVFSRPLSRGRLFLTRWAFGISFQLLTIAVVFLTVAIGLRSGTQQMVMNSPYQPMVKWYELSVLGSIALYSILSYEIVMFLKLRHRVVSVRAPTWRDFIWIVLFCVLIGMFLTGLFSNIGPLGYQMMSWALMSKLVLARFFTISGPIHNQLIYVVLVTIVGTLASLHCYQNLEIES